MIVACFKILYRLTEDTNDDGKNIGCELERPGINTGSGTFQCMNLKLSNLWNGSDKYLIGLLKGLNDISAKTF